MKPILSTVIAVIIIGSGAAGAEAALLRSTVAIDGDVIRLGDIFSGVGEQAPLIVAKAPPPGERIVIRSGQLAAIAENAGLKWSSESRFTRSTITRRARVVLPEEIESRVVAALRKEGLAESWRIELGGADLTAKVALDEERPVRIANPRYSLVGKRFSAILEIPRSHGGAERRQVTGSLYQVARVPVVAGRVQRGDIVRDHDLEYVSLPQSKIGRTVLLDRERIVGRQARRVLSPGKPVRASDIRPPVIVEKGTLGTILVQTSRMKITARRKALDDGAQGETVRVLNIRSRQTVEGTVAGRNRVSLSRARN